MSTWDYVMPHRLLINRSLRKESDRLRQKIDKYQERCSRKLVEYEIELKQAENNAEKQYEELRASLEQELSVNTELLNVIKDDFIEYSDCYISRECLYQMRNIKNAQYKILREDEGFLSEQMKAIWEEVELLEERQRELNSFTEVDDIVNLSLQSGSELNFDAGYDAKRLLETVKTQIALCDDNQRIERFALLRLKEIINERSEYLPLIKYINWVTQQKIRYSKQLSLKRAEIRDSKKTIKQSISEINSEIKTIDSDLADLNKKIRSNWEQPINELSHIIDNYVNDIKDINNKLEDIKDDQRRAKSWKEYEKLDRLSREWESLTSEKGDIKSYLSSAKQQRQEWYKRRDALKQICKDNDIWFDFRQRKTGRPTQ